MTNSNVFEWRTKRSQLLRSPSSPVERIMYNKHIEPEQRQCLRQSIRNRHTSMSSPVTHKHHLNRFIGCTLQSMHHTLNRIGEHGEIRTANVHRRLFEKEALHLERRPRHRSKRAKRGGIGQLSAIKHDASGAVERRYGINRPIRMETSATHESNHTLDWNRHCLERRTRHIYRTRFRGRTVQSINAS